MPNLSAQFIENKEVWEQLVLSDPKANFLQSYNFGQFHQNLGKNVFRLGVLSEGKLIAGASIVVEQAKRGRYLAIFGGPLLNWSDLAQVQFFFDQVKILAQQKKAVFIRFRPQEVETVELEALVKKIGGEKSPMHLTADLTLQLDLSQPPEIILASMRKNTRYEVKKAEKLGIRVTTSSDVEDIKQFYQHQLYLAKKHAFVPFSFEFLYQQFKVFVADDQALLFHSWQGDQLLASAFIIFYNHEAVYHYGVSTPENGKLPGSYACQWEAIKQAQLRGCTRYNFWGIAPEDQPDHRFAGVSLFKRGFGGQVVQYLPAHDLPISSSYQLTKGFELLRKRLRRL